MGALARIEQEEEEIVGDLLVGSDPVVAYSGFGAAKKVVLRIMNFTVKNERALVVGRGVTKN